MRYLFLVITLTVAIENLSAKTCGNKLSSAQKDTLAWLEKYYLYPKEGPGYDWPNSFQPRIIGNQVYTVDGTRIEVHPWAYDVTLGQGNNLGVEYPVTTVQYSINASSREESQKVLDELADLMLKRFKVDIRKLPRKQYDSIFEVKSGEKNYLLAVRVPTEKRGGKSEISGGTFGVDFSIRNVQHFFFSRNHLMVINDKIKLSDGTEMPILPQAKTCDISVGTIDGNPSQVVVSYTYTVTNVPQIDAEYVRLYTFLADAFKFSVKEYKIWDQQDFDVFIIAYKNDRHEIRVKAPKPIAGGGLHTGYQAKPNDTFMHLSAEIFLNNKKQIVPGYNQPLYRSQHSDQVGTDAMAQMEKDPVQEANRKRPTSSGAAAPVTEDETSGPGLFNDAANP